MADFVKTETFVLWPTLFLCHKKDFTKR